MIRYVFIPKRSDRAYKRSHPEYSARYKLPWMAKMQEVCLHTTDKRVAEQRLAELIQAAEHEHAGISAPKAIKEGAQRLIVEHLEEFTRDLTARGRSAKYVRNVRMWVSHLAKHCSWNTIADVTPESFIRWRSSQGKAPKTLNEYLASANALMNWLHRTGRALVNPLRSVGLVQTRGRERRVRRALTDDEGTAYCAYQSDTDQSISPHCLLGCAGANFRHWNGATFTWKIPARF